MDERSKKINEFLEEEVEKIIDFYSCQSDVNIDKENCEIEDIEEAFIKTLIGYIENKKKFKEGEELLN